MATKPMQPKTYDDAKLQAMSEPLTIRIEKIKGNTRTPIPMPPGVGDDGLPTPGGTNLTKNDIRAIENWLVTEWAGGGLYEITVTDSSQPNAISMKWNPYWNPAQYPEKTPPPLVDPTTPNDAAPMPAAPMQHATQPQPQQVRPMASPFPNGLPPGLPTTAPSGPYAAQPYPYYPQPYYAPPPMPAMPPPPPIGSPHWQTWQQEQERREREAEVRAMRERELMREREALEAKHRAELERERQAAEAKINGVNHQLSEMRNLIAQLTAQIQNPPKAQNTELEEMRRRYDDMQREREMERREQQTREMIRAMQEQSQKQIEMVMQQMRDFQARLAEASNNRHDPLVAMMQEQNRLNTEALKEMARAQNDAISRLQGFIMNPRDMFTLARESSQSIDGVTEKMHRLFGGVIDMQARVMENALQLQPGGSGVIDVIRDGIASAKETVEKVVTSKQMEQRLAVEAQLQAQQAQVEYAQAMAQMQAQAQQGGAIVTPPPAPQAQLAGAPAAPVEQPSNVTPITAASRVRLKRNVEDPGAPRRLGHTDKEWFGPILPEVEQVRQLAAHYVESIGMNPPRLGADDTPEGAAPEDVVQGVQQAVAMVIARGVTIRALNDLLMQDRFADFVDVLLPDLPQSYRDEVVQGLVQMKGKGSPVQLDESDGEDDEDGEDGEDGEPTETGRQRAARPVRPNGRPQAH